jgi:hypothetical protein
MLTSLLDENTVACEHQNLAGKAYRGVKLRAYWASATDGVQSSASCYGCFILVEDRLVVYEYESGRVLEPPWMWYGREIIVSLGK